MIRYQGEPGYEDFVALLAEHDGKELIGMIAGLIFFGAAADLPGIRPCRVFLQKDKLETVSAVC